MHKDLFAPVATFPMAHEKSIDWPPTTGKSNGFDATLRIVAKNRCENAKGVLC